MADTAVSFLLENVKKLVSSHYDLVSNAKDELDKLVNQLEIMKGFLETASRKNKKSEHFKAWERQVRNAVYCAEDIIDSCVTHTAHTVKGKIWQGKKFNRLLKLLSLKTAELADEVRHVTKNKVEPVFNMLDIGNMALNDSNGMETDSNISDSRSKVPSKKHVVGFDDGVKTLTGYMYEETETLDVISIVGMPGLGKTTVASKIYNDPKIHNDFPILIWACISSEFNKRDLFLTILKNFTDQELSSKTDVELSTMVSRYLEKGKFLLFLDDVWTIEAWREIQHVLPEKSTTSKVLITTRFTSVASQANRHREPYQLRFLTKNESWQLLQYELFGKVDNFPRKLGKFGELIADQCGGLPLAIIIIGGILLEKNSVTGGRIAMEREWESISGRVKGYINHGDGGKRMEKIIALSYAKLPHDLRNCFLYLGIFPEHTNIPVWNLIQLWIAEGFIKEQRGRSLEEVAHENLKELINRNLVMAGNITAYGDVKTCSLHDTIREFCQNEAGKENQDLFQEIRKSRRGIFEPTLNTTSTIRRISIHSDVEVFLLGKPEVLSARSLLCYSKKPIILEIGDIPSITDDFNLLRVLDAKPIKFPIFPTNITQLIHLRYLTLSVFYLDHLPVSFSKLWNLQTLIVDTLSRTLDIRANIWNMVQLKHLKTKASITLNDATGKGGENLQILTMLSPQNCTHSVFSKAENLNTLGIRGDTSQLLSNSNSLSKLVHLEKLKLIHEYPAGYQFLLQKFPQSHAFPQNIKYLTLSGTYLDWRHMSSVGRLCTLKVLKLKENAFRGDCWDAETGGFHDLVFLHIGLTDLKIWKAKAESFPNLISLVLKNCSKLVGIPLELGDSDNFQCLHIESIATSVVFSAKKIELKKKLMPSPQGAKKGSTFKLVIAPRVDEGMKMCVPKKVLSSL